MYAVLAFGVLVLGISIAMDIVSRNIARSIFMLGEGAKEIAGGNLAYQLPVQGDDEIAQVGQQFNVMARKLRQSHVILDQKVKDRTKEVSTILEALDRIALVSITDVKGNIVYANDRFVEVSKYDRHELMGKNHRILKSGKQPVALFVDLWDTICHGRVWRGEILNRAKDGTYYWVDTSIAPVLNDRGVPERYISVRFLITERKKAIEDLQKFQQAVAASSEAILILTVPDYAVTYVNSAWSRLTGYAAREALGRTLEYSRAVETDPRVLDALRDAMRTGRMFHSESFVLKRKDGTSYDADLTMYPVRSEEGHADENAGQVLFYVCIHRDITQKKRSEAAKSEFISLASHQLRTPLTEIRWALSGVNTDVLTDEQRDIIDAARLASVHMAETIKTMLTISSLEAGEMTADIADVPLHAMLKDVVALHDVLRRKQDVRITVQCPTDLRMRTDDQLLKEVLSNLLVNACKYTPIGGIVRVSAQEHGGTIVIEVSDTGRGIPVHDQERISQKFFRASNVTGGDQEGSGLGLHMCYALMRLLGGTIAFTSREGLGTTFTLTFPHCTS
jgi:PAS domain S-box-containing protein